MKWRFSLLPNNRTPGSARPEPQVLRVRTMIPPLLPPVIFVTPLVSRQEAGIRGGVPFVSKPVDITILLATVKQSIARQGCLAQVV